jgi:hypothetical protein
MPRVGFEPTIPVFKGAKTDHALDRGGHCDQSVRPCPQANLCRHPPIFNVCLQIKELHMHTMLWMAKLDKRTQ